MLERNNGKGEFTNLIYTSGFLFSGDRLTNPRFVHPKIICMPLEKFKAKFDAYFPSREINGLCFDKILRFQILRKKFRASKIPF